jgi:hypothetical protein
LYVTLKLSITLAVDGKFNAARTKGLIFSEIFVVIGMSVSPSDGKKGFSLALKEARSKIAIPRSFIITTPNVFVIIISD